MAEDKPKDPRRIEAEEIYAQLRRYTQLFSPSADIFDSSPFEELATSYLQTKLTTAHDAGLVEGMRKQAGLSKKL